jgi:cytochrome c oxidase cbb3-type subunit III
MRTAPSVVVAVGLALALAGCKREERRFEELPHSGSPAMGVVMSPLQPGVNAPPPPTPGHPYDENAYAVSEGQRLFDWYNCSGCHAHGGGGMGPPLMDDDWRYGSEPQNIYATIVEGRPNGMPSYRGKIPEQQVWQLVAWVRTMGGLVPSDVAPSRPEAMMPTEAPTTRTQTNPGKPTGEQAEHPR